MRILICFMVVLCVVIGCHLLNIPSLPTHNQQIDHGKQLFYEGTETVPACSGCHISSNSEHRLYIAAPKLVGIGSRANHRQPQMSATDYLHESIVYPDAYLVDGFPNSMFPDYGLHLNEYDIQSLILYLLTL